MTQATKDILVYVELNTDKSVAQVSLELGTCACELAAKLDGARVIGVVCSDTIDEKMFQTLSSAGFDEIIIVHNQDLQEYSSAKYTAAVLEVVKSYTPYIFLIGATKQGRDLAPAIATKLNVGLVADCVDLQIDEKSQLAATRPTFGDSLMATILSKTVPQMATVRPGVLKLQVSKEATKPLQKTFLTPDLSSVKNKIKLLKFKPHIKNNDTDITNAEILLVGGMGIKSAQGFALLEELAKLINAKVGASRLAVEAGFAPTSIQIGQTGKTVSPKIYISFGVSGAIQHKVGMDKSGTIIAINNDENAPIHSFSDYSIVGDAQTVVTDWVNLLKKQ